MKKLSSIVTVLLLTLGVATVGWAVIKGTPHDLSGPGSTFEICAMCHTPHATQGQPPLWNRSQTPQLYTMYSSPTFDMGPIPALDTPNYATYNCMVCHNGVASKLVNYPGRGSVENAEYNFNSTRLRQFDILGTDLMNEHPVGFTYDPSKDDENNGFPVSKTYGSGGVKKRIEGVSGGEYPLYRKTTGGEYNQFECATCHSVHHTVSYVGMQVYFLRSDNRGSAMCKDCHRNR